MTKAKSKDPFKVKTAANPFKLSDAKQKSPETHLYGKKRQHVCRTDARGYPTPKNLSLTELKLDAHEGFVPLWAKDVILRWRFQEQSLSMFENGEAAKADIRQLLGEALVGWGDAVPVKFSEQRDVVDFEIVLRANSDCDANGCTLASAFFPDAGRHEFVIYPTFFNQSRQEQIETLQHELGHIFGLRHWFANVSETTWRSEVFGADGKFTIMNYGNDSVLTAADRSDLKQLYSLVWAGQLNKINDTPIRIFKPYSSYLYKIS